MRLALKNVHVLEVISLDMLFASLMHVLRVTQSHLELDSA